MVAGTRSSKRRASSASPRKRNTKTLKRPSKLTADTKQKSSPLLDLPIELFDMIMGYIAADAGAFLCRKSTNLRSPSGLMGVSHGVRDQYQSVLNLSASEIRTEVQEFDFSHIVSFFNKLSDRELNTLPSITLPTERKFIITLVPTLARNPEPLQRWLLRLDSTTKKGTRIAADFIWGRNGVGIPSIYVLTPTGYESTLPILKTLEKWLLKLDEGRLRDEVTKIDAAIRPLRR